MTLGFGLLLGLAVHGLIGPAPVPAAVIAQSVDRDTARLEEAWQLPVATRYPRPLHWQANGSLCGPASLVNVFRSLGEKAADEGDVLEGSGKCPTGLCWMGLTLDELAEVARRRGTRRVAVRRNLSEEDFLEELRQSNDPSRRVIVNFTREAIFGSGGGHHSPIGGYLEDEDLVLVLDVHEHYGPWLVERERLFAAMNTMDGDARRGLLIVE